MTKRNTNFSKIIVMLLIVTMLALIALSGTYAKYTTAQEGTGTAIVAKWDIDFKNGETDLSKKFTIDLASTMTSKDSNNAFIQPGSKGEFTVTVANNSQVPAIITATVADNSSDVFQNDQFTLTVTGATEDSGVEIAANGTKTVTIAWEWTYSMATNTATVDAADTKIGEASDGTTAKTLCTIKLSATQKDPNA